MEFQTYLSTIEIAIDIENALNLSPNNVNSLWYYFKASAYVYQTTAPIAIAVESNKEILDFSIADLFDLLGYIPELQLTNKQIQECLTHNNQIGCFDIKNNLGFHEPKQKHLEYIASFIEFFKNTDKNIIVSKELKELLDDNTIVVDSKASALAKIYAAGNDIKQNILQLKQNELAENWIGIYWIYNNEKMFPPDEAIALIHTCKKCKNRYIINWMKPNYDCSKCKHY